MITKKELEFVNIWANKVPYPGMTYCENSMEKLEECYNLYKKEYENIEYNISFSNNEEISFKILDRNLCHMLGIDFKNLAGEYFKSFRKNSLDLDPDKTFSSYELLELIIRNKEKVLDYDLNNTGRALNYYKISIKCDIFSKLSDLQSFNYGCINFDREKFNKIVGENYFLPKSTRFLYTASNEIIAPYFLMGLRIDDNLTKANKNIDSEEMSFNSEDSYIVETLLAPDNVVNFFNDQEVVIPTQILSDRNGNLIKKEAQASDKIKLLKDYKNIINQYNLPNCINIYGDYLSLLMSTEREESKVKNYIK